MKSYPNHEGSFSINTTNQGPQCINLQLQQCKQTFLIFLKACMQNQCSRTITLKQFHSLHHAITNAVNICGETLPEESIILALLKKIQIVKEERIWDHMQ